MFERILEEIREKVRLRQYVMTLHAEEEMSDDELTIFDIERCLLTGEVVERQKDSNTGEVKTMICNICGKEGARTRLVTRNYGKGEDLLIVENIPLITCPNCGESYFTAETLQEIERIKLHRQSFTAKRQVAVAEFA